MLSITFSLRLVLSWCFVFHLTRGVIDNSIVDTGGHSACALMTRPPAKEYVCMSTRMPHARGTRIHTPTNARKYSRAVYRTSCTCYSYRGFSLCYSYPIRAYVQHYDLSRLVSRSQNRSGRRGQPEIAVTFCYPSTLSLFFLLLFFFLYFSSCERLENSSPSAHRDIAKA